jgi:hypothetical protein
MAILTYSNTEAGPSTKRVANFHSDSEDDIDITTPGTTSNVDIHNGNGDAVGKPKGKKRRVEGRKDCAEERKRRRDEAERLFVGRQGLPFYQGVLSSPSSRKPKPKLNR